MAFAWLAELVPGFAVVAVDPLASVVVFGAEEQAGAGLDQGQGEDEPGVLGNDVGDEEIDFVGEIGDGGAHGAAVGVDVVEAAEDVSGRFDLDAPEGLAAVEDEVVTFAVAERFGDGEALGDGFVGEGDFG